MGDKALMIAVAINVILTIAQIIGGVWADSLALVADALHNLNDAAALGLALFARTMARKPANLGMTFGYGRAEVIAALINTVSMLLVSFYLLSEAALRALDPQPIDGGIVMGVAGLALIIDAATVVLIARFGGGGLNMRAAFLHNLIDAATSVGVIISGGLIMLFGWYWIDLLVTVMIVGFVLRQSLGMLTPSLHILMGGAPKDVDVSALAQAITAIKSVKDIHHIHLWQIDEHRNSLEAHIVLEANAEPEWEHIKAEIKTLLANRFDICHSTLEMELPNTAKPCQDPGLSLSPTTDCS